MGGGYGPRTASSAKWVARHQVAARLGHTLDRFRRVGGLPHEAFCTSCGVRCTVAPDADGYWRDSWEPCDERTRRPLPCRGAQLSLEVVG